MLSTRSSKSPEFYPIKNVFKNKSVNFRLRCARPEIRRPWTCSRPHTYMHRTTLQRGTQRESRNSREGVKSRKGVERRKSRKRIMHVSNAVMRRSVSPLDGLTVCLLISAQLLNLLNFSDSNASKTASHFNAQQDCIHKLGLRT